MRSAFGFWLLLTACGGGESPIGNPFDGAVPDVVVPLVSACPSLLALTELPNATVVGDGTAGSCTEAALRTAVGSASGIRFNCGAAAHTIELGSPLMVTRDLSIDGEDRITLSGRFFSRILVVQADHDQNTPRLRVQRLTFVNGRSSGNGADPNQGGAAILRFGGSLEVLDCRFENNFAPITGQDVAGGAIYSRGLGPTTIQGSVFVSNQSSNGGAVGVLAGALSISNSVFEQNRATGTGGNPGNGGNGGAVYMDGQGRNLELCGVRVVNNRARAYGGGLFRVSYQREPSVISLSTFDRNEIEAAGVNSLGGGIYLQGSAIDISGTTISRNQSWGAGGIFVGPMSTVQLTNVTVAENVARDSLGGGVTLDSNVTGLFWNTTIASNRAPSPVAFGGAIIGERVELRNTLIMNNVAGNGYNPISCTRMQMNGGGNFQWPVMREGGSDDPSALCAPGITVLDVNLGTLGDHGGSTETLVPASGSPAFGAGSNCPPIDQRGEPRNTSMCTSGAVE